LTEVNGKGWEVAWGLLLLQFRISYGEKSVHWGLIFLQYHISYGEKMPPLCGWGLVLEMCQFYKDITTTWFGFSFGNVLVPQRYHHYVVEVGFYKDATQMFNPFGAVNFI